MARANKYRMTLGNRLRCLFSMWPAIFALVRVLLFPHDLERERKNRFKIMQEQAVAS